MRSRIPGSWITFICEPRALHARLGSVLGGPAYWIFIAKPGRERRVAVDLEDALFHLDERVSVECTRYPGVLLAKVRASEGEVRSALRELKIKDLLKARRLTRFVRISSPRELEPVLTRLLEELLEEARPRSLGVECYVRGGLAERKRIREIALALLERRRVELSKDSRKFLVIDVVDHLVGASIVERGDA